jgi:hypothetical protein
MAHRVVLMTPEELSEIEARAEAATPGPWWVEAISDAVRLCIGKGRSKVILGRFRPPQLPERETHANVIFCAHAREDIPKLIAEVRRLRQIIETAARFRPGNEQNALPEDHSFELNMKRIREMEDAAYRQTHNQFIRASGTPSQEAPFDRRP